MFHTHMLQVHVLNVSSYVFLCRKCFMLLDRGYWGPADGARGAPGGPRMGLPRRDRAGAVLILSYSFPTVLVLPTLRERRGAEYMRGVGAKVEAKEEGAGADGTKREQTGPCVWGRPAGLNPIERPCASRSVFSFILIACKGSGWIKVHKGTGPAGAATVSTRIRRETRSISICNK